MGAKYKLIALSLLLTIWIQVRAQLHDVALERGCIRS